MTTTEIRAYVTFAPGHYRQTIDGCDSDAAVNAIEAAVRAEAGLYASENNIVLAGWNRRPDHEAADFGLRVVVECDDVNALSGTSTLEEDMTDMLNLAAVKAVEDGAWLDEEAA